MAAGVEVRNLIGGPCKPKEMVAVHAEIAMADVVTIPIVGGAIAVGEISESLLKACGLKRTKNSRTFLCRRR